MAYNLKIRERAFRLRKQGYSIKEVSNLLKIAKSTASVWLRDIELTDKAILRLKQRRLFGQYKTRQIFLNRSKARQTKIDQLSKNTLDKIQMSKELFKICCSLLYWCEGNKTGSSVRFTNSDPSLIKTFLYLLRNSFDIDESKLKILMHLHEYHNENDQRKFWSKITRIPLDQFNRTYLKPNTGKRKHTNYPGCIAIYYHNSGVVKELISIYNTFVLRGVG